MGTSVDPSPAETKALPHDGALALENVHKCTL